MAEGMSRQEFLSAVGLPLILPRRAGEAEDDRPGEWLDRAGVLRLRPGDVLVLMVAQPLPPEEVEWIAETVKLKLPQVEVMVTHDIQQIGVLRPE